MRYFLINYEDAEIAPLSDSFIESEPLWQYVNDIQTILDSQTDQVLVMDFNRFEPIPSSIR